MNNLKNRLPVAVHLASGGDARVRVGGVSIPLEGEATASFITTGATRFRLTLNARSVPGVMLLIGYDSPLTLANAPMLCSDMDSVTDDVPEGTTVYIALVNPMDGSAVTGGEEDHAVISFYA